VNEAPRVPTTLQEANDLIAFLLVEIKRLADENAQLRRENAELRARLDMNSSNSSKPPSSDPPWRKRKPPEPPSGKKPGGQPGHNGHARQMFPPEKVTRFLEVRPQECSSCGALLDASIEGYNPAVYQQVELPPVKPDVTQYTVVSCRCPHCHAVNRAPVPVEVAGSPFGPRLQATIAMLSSTYSLSRRNVVAILKDLYGIDISLGALQGACETVSEAVAPAVTDVRATVTASSSIHLDETGWWEKKDRTWVWVITSSDAEVFLIQRGRGGEALGRLLPETFKGAATTDRWGAYESRFDVSSWQMCHAHLRRDFQGLIDRGGAAKVVGDRFLGASNTMFKVWHSFTSGQIDRVELQRRMRGVQISWGQCVSAAMECPDRKAAALGKSLNENWHALWTFVYRDGVEPTNNDAERALRKVVLLRKRSFGTQSAAGSQFVSRLMTVAGTARRRGIHLLDWLTDACRAHLSHQPAPLLLSPA